MQQLFNILALLVATVSGTQASEALVLTFGDSPLPNDLKASAISDHLVQQILGLRMEFDLPFILGDPDQDTIETLNNLAGAPAPLFGSNQEHNDLSRNLLVLEGMDSELVSSIQNEFQQNLLAKVPSEDLLSHLFASTSPVTESGAIYTSRKRHCKLQVDTGVPSDLRQPGTHCIPDGSVFAESTYMFESELLGRASMVESWVDEQTSAAALKISFQSPSEFKTTSSAVDLLSSVLDGLNALSSGNRQISVVLLSNPNALQGTTEFNSRSLEKKVTLSTTPNGGSGVIPRSDQLHVAPVCFASNSSCTELTSNCSGHGYCYKKSGSRSQTAGSDCYACRCQESIVRKDDGSIRKIQWGGSACQKRDISSPFFLIAGITIVIVVATGAAVGMLYHTGQEQLPGVISAGVGAVRTQK